MKILIELPDQLWDLDGQDPLSHFVGLKQTIERVVIESVIEKYIPTIELPAIEIKPEEVKDRMLTLLAEKALEKK